MVGRCHLVVSLTLIEALATLNSFAVGHLFQTKSGLDGNTWSQVKDLGFNQISMGFDDSLWGITSGEEVYKLDEKRKTWHKLPGQLIQVSGLNRNHAWGLDSKGHVYRYSEGLWNQVNGRLTAVSASTTDEFVQSVEHVWGINNEGYLVYCGYQRTLRGCSWKPLKPPRSQLKPVNVAALGDGQVFAIFAKEDHKDSLITYRWDKKKWSPLKNIRLKRINGSSGRQIVGLDEENEIQVYSLDKDEWIHVDSPDGEVAYPAVGKAVTVLTDRDIPLLPSIKIAQESVSPVPDESFESAEQNGFPAIAARPPWFNQQSGSAPYNRVGFGGINAYYGNTASGNVHPVQNPYGGYVISS